MLISRKHRNGLVFAVCTAFLAVSYATLFQAHAAPQERAFFMLSPSSGAFSVDSTFNVTVAINTAGNTINTFKAKIYFPPDKLQVISSGVGQSITGFWVNRPMFSNENGYVELQGAIPSPGISTDQGIIATITFRAKALGRAIVRFDSDSTMYLNDGNGTELPSDPKNAVFDLTLPPPEGPVVVSSTHPDQSKWYNINDVILSWASQYKVGGYSYVLNQSPIDLPDTTAEGTDGNTIYKGLADGVYYFHIRALRDGVWGGVTHFGVKIQTSSPAKFTLDIEPGKRTSSKNVVLSFETSDTLSGVDHYEARSISLQPKVAVAGEVQPKGHELFFFELTSPYVLRLSDYGEYQIVVRAYNHAGNYTEASEKITVVKPLFRYIAPEGISVGDIFVIPWMVFWAVIVLILLTLAYIALHVFRWHVRINIRHQEGAIADVSVADKLAQLRDRFRSLKMWLVIGGAIATMFVAGAIPVQAAKLSAPITNLVSSNITNNEIFYIGGRAAAGSGSKVIVYLQSLFDGQTFSFETPVSANGEWFYSHPAFLQSGEYRLWTQLKIGDETSPPSSELKLAVESAAIQLGASRLSYETIYLVLLAIALLAIISLVTFIAYHLRHGRRKYQHLKKEVREAEESIRRGFAVLRRDIQAEIDVIKKIKMSKELTAQEHVREEQLLKDLAEINDYVGKEVWDIERVLDAENG